MSERIGTVEKARLTDAVAIQLLVNGFAARGDMLPRPLSQIYEDIDDFVVYREENEVVGCGALHILWKDSAELKAVVVREDKQYQGIGSRLVFACLDRAEEKGVSNVSLLTYKPDFFGRFGFQRADIETLPLTLWRECYDCPKYNPHVDCGEIAMVRQV